MIDLTNVTHHPVMEEIVDVLCARTQNTDKGFFRAEVAYFLGKMASCMRTVLVTKDRGEVPVNIYALALGTSGYGKGHSVNIMETAFLAGFKKRFLEETMPTVADKNLWDMADSRAVRNGTDNQEEYDALSAEYSRAGAYPFTFDSGTVPAVKQLRHKLLLASCGSINLQIDEIGSNLINSSELLTMYLELYDQGMTKNKLTKNTHENTRSEEVDGKTPANMLLFGTPSKLLDGGMTEDQFYEFLETGYARRCIFGIGMPTKKAMHHQSAEEIYKHLTSPSNNAIVDKWASKFTNLADPVGFGWQIEVPDDLSIKLLEYKIACEKEADAMPEHEEIRKAELSHRYFKVLKLAGAYAFIDQSIVLSMSQLEQAILLVEESGKAFQSILNREKAYVKLAKYIAEVGTEVTHADLHEALPFYKSSNAARNEMMTLATAWGYKKHIIIKKSFVDGIEFFKGETLKETDLSKMILSYSDHWAYHYERVEAPFDQLDQLVVEPDMHWTNHAFVNQHRAEENVIPGFNMIVVDIDGGVPLTVVHEVLKEYKFMTYTTKRHTEEENRFRLVIPINYYLDLDSDDYKEFMNHFTQWLPFPIDEAANQRSRKWLTNEGAAVHYNMDGELLDALAFIPKTSKNESFKASMQKVESLDNLERWFAQKMASGNRNNNMIRYALILVDSGMDLLSVSKQIHEFNKKLSNPLSEDEIDSTILRTVAKKLTN